MLIHRERVFALDHFEAYLYSSVKNRALSSIKRNQKTAPYSPELEDFRPLVRTAADPFELLVEQELNARVHKIIREFPPKRKMVYRLIREDGHSYRQVAGLMEISERTVEVHL
jgi:RNA polymerase sigma-70 factor (ECF subfamily)